MIQTDIKVGQQVKVINCGRAFSDYKEWAKAWIPPLYRWKYGESPTNGTTGKVLAVAPHSNQHSMLCAIYDKDANITYIINVEGVALFTGTVVNVHLSKSASNKDEDHDGMIHNPITNKWSWF